MQHYKPGDQARIVQMPDRASGLIGKVVTIAMLGGLGNEPGDLFVATKAGLTCFVKEHQLYGLSLEQTSCREAVEREPVFGRLLIGGASS